MTNDTITTFQRVAPPTSLLDWLDAVDSHKRKQGDSVPEEIMAWAQTWRDIRADGASAVDGRMQQVAELVNERMAANVKN